MSSAEMRTALPVATQILSVMAPAAAIAWEVDKEMIISSGH